MTNKPGQLRADAAQALFLILENGQSSREVIAELASKHNEQDRAWLQEMLFGVLRQLPLLQYWLRNSLQKPLKQRAKVVEHLILLGLYQLAFTRVSTHAAVSETVAACKLLNNLALKGLVNAILRNFIRKQGEEDLPNDPQILSGLPKWLYKSLAQAYPEQLDGLTAAMQQKAPLWLRVNQQQTSRQTYSQQLTTANIQHQISPELEHGLYLGKSTDVTRLPGYTAGHFAVQDGAAQWAAQLLNAQPGERILDCCAAPGGKTCHIIERCPYVAEVTALEIDPLRLTRVAENLQRLQLKANLLQGDAAKPQEWWDKQQYERILLDAPCSATGIIRRHPDIKWLRKGSDIATLVQLQSEILDAIWPLLKPGGTLLYATCSILPDENQQQISAFLARTNNAQLQPIANQSDPTHIGWQILPGQQQMDGFYYARLLKSGV